MRSRRTTELLLLGAGTPVVLLAFATFLGSGDEPLWAGSFAVPAGVLVAFLLAHLSLRRFAPEADPGLLPIAYVLTGIGLVFVTRLVPEAAARQVLWVFVGVAMMVATLVLMRSLETVRRFKYTTALGAIALLVLPAVVGTEINGAKLWIVVAGTSFQPGEIAKILLVLFLAAYLSDNREMLSVSTRRVLGLSIPEPATLFPLLVMWALSLLVVVAERDLGSALLLFGIFLVMIYATTGRAGYVVGGLALFAAGGTAAWRVFSHVQTRISIWLDPFPHASDKGYQLVQSLYALADGGMAGVGIGNGMPERIPFVSTDFIFSAIGEELGLLGAGAVILLFLLFAIRGFVTAARAKSDLAALTAVGLVAAISLQAFVIIGGVTRLIPLTGVTLPFISRGGSSLLSSFIVLALLLRAGDEGTGLQTEIQTAQGDTGALGRIALGRRLTGLTTVFALLFAALVANLTYIQVIQADRYAARPDNTRSIARSAHNARGSILSADGVVLAQSTRGDDGTYVRTYPEGTLAAHTLGYVSATYGRAGIEAAADDVLTGTRTFATWADVIDAASGRPTEGNDLVLTIDTRVQHAAVAALDGAAGAVVALDPATGAVLASASSPTFDPNAIADVLGAAGDGSGLVDRVRDARYPPGSTFKVVTLTAALSEGVATPDRVFSAPASIEIGNAPITNYDGSSAESLTLVEATARSLNTVFAQLADELGPKALVEQAKKFGFGSTLGTDLTAKASLMPDPSEMTEWETAWAGVGQPVGEHESPAGPQATPLQMALVAAAIANDGVVMEPHVVARVLDPAGRVLDTTRPHRLSSATDTKTADTVASIMETVVSSGTGRPAAIPGVRVAGKTGTAEVGSTAASHTWFIGFAPADDPVVAVAVIVENGEGGTPASARAKAVLQAALAR